MALYKFYSFLDLISASAHKVDEDSPLNMFCKSTSMYWMWCDSGVVGHDDDHASVPGYNVSDAPGQWTSCRPLHTNLRSSPRLTPCLRVI